MSRRISFFLFIVILATTCIYTYKLEVPETRTWAASGTDEISATTRNGKITVAATSDTTITARITRRCYGRNKADAERYLENVEIKDTVIGNELQLYAEMPGGSRNYGAYFEMTAPESTHLVLSTSNGQVSLTSMICGADLSTSNSDVSLLNTRGRIQLSTSNGKVTVQVHQGGIDAQTSNGEISCDLASLGPTESAILETSNGKVTLSLPSDVSAAFDARTSNGDITITGFSSITYETSERTHKRGQIGSGASIITVSTSNADIIIRAR